MLPVEGGWCAVVRVPATRPEESLVLELVDGLAPTATITADAATTLLELPRSGFDRRLENVQVIFRMQPKSRAGHHFGSRLVFDGKGKIFFSVGERGGNRGDDHHHQDVAGGEGGIPIEPGEQMIVQHFQFARTERFDQGR